MSIEEVAFTAGKMRTEWVYIDREIGANVYFMKFFGANRIRECAFPRADSRFAQPNAFDTLFSLHFLNLRMYGYEPASSD